MRRGSIVAAVLTAVALVLVAAACGGSKTAAPTTTTTAGATGATGAIGPTGAGPTGAGGFASSKNCRDFALIGSKIASAIGSTTGAGASSAETAKAELQAWADAAPDEIKGDFQTIAAAFADFVDAVNSSGYTLGSTTPPNAAQIVALSQAAKAFTTPQMKAASKHIQTWTATNCAGMGMGH